MVHFKVHPREAGDLFNYGMDFVTEISNCKTPVVDEKVLVLETERLKVS